MFKKCKCILLATNEKAHFNNIILVPDTNKLIIFEHQNCTEVKQHLYITSDEEIKVDNWYCTLSGDEGILQCSCKEEANDLTNVWKKIIASTDLSLNLPYPSQSFIEKYIQEYNKRNVASEVMVEYVEYHGKPLGIEVDIVFPKVSKDNTITIKKIKDSWNREEMIIIVKKMILEERDYQDKYHHFVDTCDLTNWIDKNL